MWPNRLKFCLEDVEKCPLYVRIPLFLVATPVAIVVAAFLMIMSTVGILIGMFITSFEFLITGGADDDKF